MGLGDVAALFKAEKHKHPVMRAMNMAPEVTFTSAGPQTFTYMASQVGS